MPRPKGNCGREYKRSSAKDISGFLEGSNLPLLFQRDLSETFLADSKGRDCARRRAQMALQLPASSSDQSGAKGIR
jgi:hypothetical protein